MCTSSYEIGSKCGLWSRRCRGPTGKGTDPAQGSVRTLRPGHTFTLSEHASQDPSKPHIVLRVIHQARNNLSAELHAASQSLQDHSAQQGPSPLEMGVGSYINHSKTVANTNARNTTFYRNSTMVLPLMIPQNSQPWVRCKHD